MNLSPVSEKQRSEEKMQKHSDQKDTNANDLVQKILGTMPKVSTYSCMVHELIYSYI